ncbi:MAG: hypothetical protein JXR78_05450 [Victivallales bacterium]|nr:hypothetical protein [Victivallales bacterium]
MSGRYGIMVHYLLPQLWSVDGVSYKDPDKVVNAFDLDIFMRDFDATHSEWLIFTIGQNTGYYCSPNDSLEYFVGSGHCTKRDLLLEIARAVKQRGKRFIAYLPCEVFGNESIKKPLGWEDVPGSKQTVFQQRYTQIIEEWSLRLDNLLDGWWLDGFFDFEVFPQKNYDMQMWMKALRRGNPNAIVTFNDGCFCTRSNYDCYRYFDYLPGEAEVLVDGRLRLGRDVEFETCLPGSALAPNAKCQWHALLPIDAFWALGGAPGSYLPSEHRFPPVEDINNPGTIPPPIYSDTELSNFTRDCLSVGGAVTFNAGIYMDGSLSCKTVRQIKAISEQQYPKTIQVNKNTSKIKEETLSIVN